MKERKSLLAQLKANTIFKNSMNQLYVPYGNGRLCLGSVTAKSNEELKSALKKGGFIC